MVEDGRGGWWRLVAFVAVVGIVATALWTAADRSQGAVHTALVVAAVALTGVLAWTAAMTAFLEWVFLAVERPAAGALVLSAAIGAWIGAAYALDAWLASGNAAVSAVGGLLVAVLVGHASRRAIPRRCRR